MALTSVNFLFSTLFGACCVVAYFAMGFVLLRHRKLFKGSFFDLYLISSVVNVLYYLNSFIGQRLPQSTCKTCLLAPIYESGHIFGLEFFHAMQVHFNAIQFSLIMLTSLNRCTMFFYPMTYERIWTKALVPSVLLSIFAPFLATQIMIFGETELKYVPYLDGFVAYSNGSGTVLTILAVFALITTLVSTIANLAAFFKLTQHRTVHKSAQRAEINLLWVSISNFVFGTMLTAISIILVLSKWITFDIPIVQWSLLVLPYAADALTLFSPFLLFLFCTRVQNVILRRETTQTVVVVSMRTR